MGKTIFQSKFNRENYLNFLQSDMLPDDFETKIEDIDFQYIFKYVRKISILAECKSLNLVVIEISIDSRKNPLFLPIKEVMKIMNSYLFSNAIIFSVPIYSKYYRMSLVTSNLKLEGKKVLKAYNSIKEMSLYLGYYSTRRKMDIYKPLEICNRISNLEELSTWFFNSHSKTYFKPSRHRWNRWEAFLDHQKKEENEKKRLNKLSTLIESNPFENRYIALDLDSEIEVFDDEIIYENLIPNSEDNFIIAAYTGFENYLQGNYFDAIQHLEKALLYNIDNIALLHSILAKCFFYEKDFDNFINHFFSAINIDYEYIDDELYSFIDYLEEISDNE